MTPTYTSPATNYDVLVIGGGMAGVSVGALVATTCRVAVLEREERPGMHATGRSAALYAPAYGSGATRRLTKASATMFRAPTAPGDAPFLRPRATMLVATEAQRPALQALHDEEPTLFEWLDGAGVRARVPIFRTDGVAHALLDESSADIDVDALLHHYLRMLRRYGGALLTGAGPTAIAATPAGWQVETARGTVTAPVLVDAAGAWADEVATLAGARPVGLSPRRRTAALVDAPACAGFDRWPSVIDAAERFYFKPEAGKLLVSPAEETEVEPHDAYADDQALAEGIDRIMRLTTLAVERMPRSWAGLRTFAADRLPVIGFATDAPGFFWLAGQGGYGIQTAPAAAELAASLILKAPLPNFADDALVAALSPGRFS